MIISKYRICVFWVQNLIIFIFFISLSAYTQVRVEEGIQINSSILNKQVPITVILPTDYYIARTDYPVVYLLHGFGGDHISWINRCSINTLIDSLEQQGASDDCIYILPDAKNSYYINNYDSSFNYSDFFAEELVPYVDSSFRTIPEKSSRALLGLSMGGFGSIILAVKHPEIFGTVVALSAAVRNVEILKSLPEKKYEKLYSTVFGPGLVGEDRVSDHWKMNSPYYLIDSLNAGQYAGINWYIDCGLNDFLLPANEAFHELLMQYSIPHEFHVRPGSHNWAYWYSSSADGFIYISEIFRSRP